MLLIIGVLVVQFMGVFDIWGATRDAVGGGGYTIEQVQQMRQKHENQVAELEEQIVALSATNSTRQTEINELRERQTYYRAQIGLLSDKLENMGEGVYHSVVFMVGANVFYQTTTRHAERMVVSPDFTTSTIDGFRGWYLVRNPEMDDIRVTPETWIVVHNTVLFADVPNPEPTRDRQVILENVTFGGGNLIHIPLASLVGFDYFLIDISFLAPGFITVTERTLITLPPSFFNISETTLQIVAHWSEVMYIMSEGMMTFRSGLAGQMIGDYAVLSKGTVTVTMWSGEPIEEEFPATATIHRLIGGKFDFGLGG